MGVLERLKARARHLRDELSALYYAYQSPLVPWPAKALTVLTLGYSLSPLDLIPDFIPILGQLDDLIIVPALIALSIRLIPAKVLAICRQRARTEPVTLRKNWPAALIVVGLWLLLASLLISALI